MNDHNFDRNLRDFYVKRQLELCNQLKVEYHPVDPNQIIGLSDNMGLEPTHGLKHPNENQASGWYIWTQDYSSADDFFKPHHIGHLLTINPAIIKYLGLPAGYRFLVDLNDYEDVWYDESLLKILNKRQLTSGLHYARATWFLFCCGF